MSLSLLGGLSLPAAAVLLPALLVLLPLSLLCLVAPAGLLASSLPVLVGLPGCAVFVHSRNRPASGRVE